MNEIVETEKVKQDVLPISQEARAIIVKDQISLAKANECYLLIDKMRKKIKEIFEPIVNKAKEAKKKADETRAEAVKQWGKVEEPLVKAREYLDQQIVTYKQEQDRKREAELERLRQQAIKEEAERRKKEEDKMLAQAAKLEKAGATEEAQSLFEEAMEQTESPLEIQPQAPKTPEVKLEGISISTLWHAEVYDLKVLCRAVSEGKCASTYVEANMTVLNTLAKKLEKEMNIPGVRAVSETKSRPTGR